ncbi:WD40 repeat domain-containing protein [Tautonia plasticadhaerens]|uniref:WD40 repeat domain-containing protein n=1 Tax=Tautonia plasticadhaerens TaxID=2527974 RepID=UPI0018D26507|nr:WD40 repeat domain-containing protein [Tautonia plasticadhaerens]
MGLTFGAAACLATLIWAEFAARPGRRAAYAVAFSPRGDRVAAVSEGEPDGTGRLWIWDVATGRRVASAIVPDRPLSLAYAPGGSAVATGGWDGTVQLRDPTTGGVLRSFDGHSTPVRGLAFLPDGDTLVAGASDGRAILWDVATGRERMRFDRGHRSPINGLAISHDGRVLAVAGGLGAGGVGLWDLETARPLRPTSLLAHDEPIAFAPDRAVLASRASGRAGGISLVDLDGDRVVSTVPSRGARSVAFSPDGRLIAIGDDEETVTVREAMGGRPVAVFGGHRHRPDPYGDAVRNLMAEVDLAEPRVQNSVWAVSFSPDGAWLASCGQDGAVWLWGLPGRDGVHHPDRMLLPRPSRPVWLPIFQFSLAFAALALSASAFFVMVKPGKLRRRTPPGAPDDVLSGRRSGEGRHSTHPPSR